MSRKRFENFNCSIAKSLDQIGDWWTLLIVREAFFGVRSFSSFQKNLGIAKNILTARLEKMVAAEIFEKRICAQDSRSYDYVLTDKGRELFPVLIALMQWGDKWTEGEAPVLISDKLSGQKIETMSVHSQKGDALKMRDVNISPGPGATSAMRAKFKNG